MAVKGKKAIIVINIRILRTLQSKRLSAQQLPLAYEEPFTIYKALSLLSPGMQSGERAAWGQFSPLQRGNLEAQRGWVGWLRLPSWLQREPGLRGAPPSSCLYFWALILLPWHQHHVFLQPFLPWEHSSHLISVLSPSSQMWTPLASDCVTTGKRRCFSEPQSSRLWGRYEPVAPQAARGLKCKAENHAVNCWAF